MTLRPLAVSDEKQARQARRELAQDAFDFLLDLRRGEPWPAYLARLWIHQERRSRSKASRGSLIGPERTPARPGRELVEPTLAAPKGPSHLSRWLGPLRVYSV